MAFLLVLYYMFYKTTDEKRPYS